MFIFVFGFWVVNLNAQDSKEYMRKGIAYYQSMEFEKAIENFDMAAQLDSANLNILARRGYVCAKYIQAVDNQDIPEISRDRYMEIVKKGIDDLKITLAKFPDNSDNQKSLKFLESKL